MADTEVVRVGQPKVIVALVAALVLAIGAFVVVGPVPGVLVLVLGAGAVVLLMRQGGTTTERPRRARDDEFLEAEDDAAPRASTAQATPLSTWAPDPTEAEPLGTWSQGTTEAEPLSAWSPDTTEAEPLGTWEAEPLSTWDAEPLAEPAEETAPDEADEIAFASSLISSPINEDVASADDIMAASEATELHIPDADEGDDSELAKLLAKVQARLAAYE
jgi:hypothetical protein